VELHGASRSACARQGRSPSAGLVTFALRASAGDRFSVLRLLVFGALRGVPAEEGARRRHRFSRLRLEGDLLSEKGSLFLKKKCFKARRSR